MIRLPLFVSEVLTVVALGLFAMTALLSGCYVGPGAPIFSAMDDGGPYVYKLYPGPELPESDVAVVELASAYYAQIDGFMIQHADYERVHLLPGEHVIRWGRRFTVSVLVDPDMFAEGSLTAVLDLEGGHTYELHADRTTGPGYRKYFWITDSASGEVVAGEMIP